MALKKKQPEKQDPRAAKLQQLSQLQGMTPDPSQTFGVLEALSGINARQAGVDAEQAMRPQELRRATLTNNLMEQLTPFQVLGASKGEEQRLFENSLKTNQDIREGNQDVRLGSQEERLQKLFPYQELEASKNEEQRLFNNQLLTNQDLREGSVESRAARMFAPQLEMAELGPQAALMDMMFRGEQVRGAARENSLGDEFGRVKTIFELLGQNAQIEHLTRPPFDPRAALLGGAGATGVGTGTDYDAETQAILDDPNTPEATKRGVRRLRGKPVPSSAGEDAPRSGLGPASGGAFGDVLGALSAGTLTSPHFGPTQKKDVYDPDKPVDAMTEGVAAFLEKIFGTTPTRERAKQRAAERKARAEAK